MASVVAACGCIALCAVIAWAAGHAADGRTAVAVEPPFVPALPGLIGTAVIGLAVWGSGSHPALALMGFGLLVVGDDVAAGRRASLDRLAAAGLVVGACVLPFVRYGVLSYGDLRGAALVLGPPALTGPLSRWVAGLAAIAVALVAGSWLVTAAGRVAPATAVARPSLMVPGAAGLLITASFFGPALPEGAGVIGLLGRLSVWAAGVAAIATVLVVLAPRVRALPRPPLIAIAAGGVLAVGLAGAM